MRKVVKTTEAPSAVASYSQGIIYSSHSGKMLFTAGQIGLDPYTGELVQGGITAQMERVMQNLKAVIEAGNTSLNRVIKVTIYMVDMDDYAAVNEVYSRYFSDKPPARSAVQVVALPKGALVEVECIAAVS